MFFLVSRVVDTAFRLRRFDASVGSHWFGRPRDARYICTLKSGCTDHGC